MGPRGVSDEAFEQEAAPSGGGGRQAQAGWGDLKLEGDRPSIDLRAATAKSRKAARIPVYGELRQALQEWREAQAEPPSASSSLFPSLLDMKAYRADLALAGIRFEVPGRGVVDFHALRKTFGTWLAAGGIPRGRAASVRAPQRHGDHRIGRVILAIHHFFVITKLSQSLGRSCHRQSITVHARHPPAAQRCRSPSTSKGSKSGWVRRLQAPNEDPRRQGRQGSEERVKGLEPSTSTLAIWSECLSR
jgi:hypothetical protein